LQYDGLATVNQPLSTATFDCVNHRLALYSHHPYLLPAFSPAPYSVQSVSGSDLAHIIFSVVSSIAMVHIPLKPPLALPHPMPVIITPSST
jgi:hypothetical protein